MKVKDSQSFFQRRFEVVGDHEFMLENSPTVVAQVRNYSRYRVRRLLGTLEDIILGDGIRFHGLVDDEREEEIEQKINELEGLINESVDEEWEKYREKIYNLREDDGDDQ